MAFVHETRIKIQNNFSEFFLMMHSTKIAQKVPLCRVKEVWIILFCGVMPLLKGHNEILLSRYLKNYNSYEHQT